MLIDPAAIAALRDGQRQLDADGVEVGVSRQALDMLLDWHDRTPRPFNGLTPAEAERLSMLAEEAAEVIVAVEKIKRHGYASVNPDEPDKGDNRRQLCAEITDFAAVRYLMDGAGDLAPMLGGDLVEAVRRKLRHAHHQEGGGLASRVPGLFKNGSDCDE